ncbi:MAG TPA: TonB-dependent receptor [Blastocatellia bacterium]|nr:TonB-dependent receptor [Blastocatellia bacterium]
MKSMQKLLYSLLILILTATVAIAQNANSGEIKGSVVDATGAVVDGVTVTIVNVQTNVKTTFTTNSDGLYDAPSVPTGEYKITFSKTGFRDLLRQGIVLQIGTITVDATLQPGAASEQVVITAEAPLLATDTSEQHVTFDTKTIKDAPIVGGVWYNELTAVLPGVAGGSGSSGEGIAVNGTRSFDANWLIEGSSVTDVRDNNPSDNYPPVDAIAEVHVNTSNFGAQYGNGVATLNLTFKSGVNKWHGSAFEFLQNNALDSLNFFNSSHLAAPVRWNEYGGSVGGPILKDKLFFFFTFQRNVNSFSALYTATVPTQAMRNGDFSDPAFKGTIFDQNSCSGNCAKTPLNGGSNKLLSSQIDPVASAIQSLYPLPNLPGLTNNFQTVVSTPTISKWYVGKVDYQINANNRLSGSILTYPIALTFNADAFCGLGFDCTRSNPVNRNTAFQITDTWTINATMVNEARFGHTREHDGYVPGTFGKGFPTKIGLEPAYGTNAPADIFPNLTINGGAGVGQIGLGGGVHADLLEGIYSGSDVLTLIHGKHTIKIGGQYDKNFQNYTNWGDVSSGNFTFSGVGTSSGTSIDPRAAGTCGSPTCTGSGIPYADFLLGNVEAWFVFNDEATSAKMWNLGGFVQDDFKAAPRLTLNLGLRYQRQSGYSVDGNKFGVFDPTLPNPGPFIPPNTLGALLYGGTNGRNTIENGVNEFAPRVGVAWSPWNKWSFRASYGIFDSPRDAEAYTDGVLALGLNPQGSTGFANTVVFKLRTGPAPNSVVFPTLATLSPALLNFKDVHYYNPNLPVQYSQEIYLDVQHEVPGGFLLDAGYVNTRGSNLNFSRDMNQVPVGELGTGKRPFVQYATIKNHAFDGYSNYNALQLRVVKRLTHGLSMQANYAWSKFLDTGTGSGHSDSVDIWQNAYSVRSNYGYSTLDATHNFTGFVSYQLPVGEGRAYPVHGVLNQVAGGWWISSIFSARSGVPFTPTMGTDNSGALSGSCFCGFAQLPNRIGSGQLSNPTINQWFDPAAFVAPGANTFGDSGRNILRGPRYVDVDMSLGKSFRIREGMSFELRADAFNALNHPNFSLPNSSITAGSTAVAKITSTTTFGGPDRIIQLGGRFIF